MHLKQIKLAGFKSFVDSTTLVLPGNRCAIVGPNGCGKTTTARSLCLLDPKTSGSVNFYNPTTKSM